MHIVYMPMIALKVVRYPLNKIISQNILVSQLSIEEQKHIRNGIEALVELGIFVQDRNDICLTNFSEGLIKIYDNFSLGTAEQVNEELKSSPKVQSVFDTIERDYRFSPMAKVNPVKIASNISTTNPSSEVEPMSLGNKIFFGIFLLWMFLGMLKVVFGL
jgi:hypothetical protein